MDIENDIANSGQNDFSVLWCDEFFVVVPI